jgi:hypothetical protein
MTTSKNYNTADSGRDKDATHTRRPEVAAATGSRAYQADAAAGTVADRTGIEFERVKRDTNPLSPATIDAYRKKFNLT